MWLESHKAEWEELAAFDPMWAVLTDTGKRGNKWDEREFFAAGKAEIDSLMAEAGRLSESRGKALDFGCGLGRLTRALLGYYREAYGVDVSETMIRKAQAFSPECQFHVNEASDLSLFPDRTFDLVYSNRVLQHLPSAEAITKYVKEFFRVATPGGLVIFQVPFRKAFRSRFHLRRTAYRLLRFAGMNSQVIFARFTKLYPMRMTAIRPGEVLAAIREAGGELLLQRPDTSAPFAVLYYCRRPDVGIGAAGVRR